MYQPKKYKKEDPDALFHFIREHPFATFVLNGDRILATHIPVLIKGESKKFVLFGHIAKHNEQCQYLKDGTDALLIFQGAHGYISSSWYEEKNISTWDYSAVHVNVKLRIQTEKELEDSLRELVTKFERDQENPLYYDDIPEDVIKDHLPHITGFWCEPVKIEGIAKLHQGFSSSDIRSVVTHLRAREDDNSTLLGEQILKENGQSN